jgi:hypothetical protein
MLGIRPGKKYRVRPQGELTFVDGFFHNFVFYEGRNPVLRVGFIDLPSGLFYRHGVSHTELYFRTELAGRLSGLTLTCVSGGVYYLVESIL